MRPGTNASTPDVAVGWCNEDESIDVGMEYPSHGMSRRGGFASVRGVTMGGEDVDSSVWKRGRRF